MEPSSAAIEIFEALKKELNSQLAGLQAVIAEQDIVSELETRSTKIVKLTSNELDVESMDIICQNLREFGKLTAGYGFELIVHYDENDQITIKLVPKVENSYASKLITELHNLIKSKRPEDDSVEGKLKKMIASQLSPSAQMFKEKLDSFLANQNQALSDLRREVDNRIDSKSEMKPTTSLDSFYQKTHLEILWEHPRILQAMCDRLSSVQKGDKPSSGKGRNSRVESPIHKNSPDHLKRQKWISYINMLQTKIEQNKRLPSFELKARDWLEANWKQFCYKPTDSVMERKKMEIEERYGLKGVVGTVHFFALTEDITQTNDIYFVAMAIMDKRIVSLGGSTSKKKAITNLHRILSDVVRLKVNSKFATDFEIRKEYSDLFTWTGNHAVFGENEKVATWVRNNFAFLRYDADPSYMYAIPFIYHYCLDYCN